MKDWADEKLMELVAKQDSRAFQELLSRHSSRVFRFAWRLCLQQALAEDLTQDVFMRVWQKAASWQASAKLETWLYRITYNRFLDIKRQVKFIPEKLSEELSCDKDTPEEALLKKTQSLEVATALEALPERQKEAVILCYYQGIKAKEAAEILNLSQSALEALLFRARQTLKEKLRTKQRKGN